MWDHHCRFWVSTQIGRRREPTFATGCSYDANTIVCRCTWRPNWWPSSFHAGSTRSSVLTHFAIVLLVLLLLTPSITSLRALSGLSCTWSKFQRCCPFLWGSPNFFYDGPIFTQLYLVVQNPNSAWWRTNHLNKIILSEHNHVSQHPNQTRERVSTS